jgi:hypothetical protein
MTADEAKAALLAVAADNHLLLNVKDWDWDQGNYPFDFDWNLELNVLDAAGTVLGTASVKGDDTGDTTGGRHFQAQMIKLFADPAIGGALTK